MAAGKYNTVIERGATFRKTLTWKDSAGNPVNLTGYDAKMQLRDASETTLHLELSVSNGYITFNPTYGQILLHIPANVTAGIEAHKVIYDLQLTAPGGDTIRLIEGKISISQEVTK